MNNRKKAGSAETAGRLDALERHSLDALEGALVSVRELSSARSEAKLSVSRLAGVARELRELIKVMSVYGC